MKTETSRDRNQRRVLNLVKHERNQQDYKWGHPLDRKDAPWLPILGEEYGEVCRACLGNDDAGNLRDELVQVAAVAIAWLEAMGK